MYYSGDGTDCWIGLYKSESDTSHYWLDGNNSTYRNWERGKTGDDDCVLIRDGTFRGKPCINKYRYVCKGYFLSF